MKVIGNITELLQKMYQAHKRKVARVNILFVNTVQQNEKNILFPWKKSGRNKTKKKILSPLKKSVWFW
jgi:hypothetical protein